jgi:hypothetical protein
LPLWRMGKFREALTVNTETYKKQLLRYLETRGYYVKASSDVESTFADCILVRKGEKREYWLEAKATTISLAESSFLSQLGKYISYYLLRVTANRFKMMIACYRITNGTFFEQVFEKFDTAAINEVIGDIIKSSNADVQIIISNANAQEVRQFFMDTTVVEADLKDLQVAEEKVAPTVPVAPNLSEADYAAQILNKFGDVEPLKGSDKVFLNLFRLNVPQKLYVAGTRYQTAQSIFDEKPDEKFPLFDLLLGSGLIYSFDSMGENVLGKFVDLNSIRSVDLKEFAMDQSNSRIVTRLLNRWINRKCRNKRLEFDPRTHSYFYPRKVNDDSPITETWMPRFRRSTRELTKLMKIGNKINYWVHRAANISARRFWDNYYVQIRSRFLFSPDGTHLFEGEKTDTLDRAFRKSIYSRNLNQFYDALFWYRHVFPEADTRGNSSLDPFLERNINQSIRVLEQIHLETECKPTIETSEEVEQLDKIEEMTPKPRTLYDFA